ncbi:MAG: dephospho-CoA kinase [Gaiellaceae bacterium]
MAVAVTGGIGAGKSEALRAFERHGAAVISSDEIVHELLRSDPKVRQAIRERFGDPVFGSGGEIDRSRVAELVFGRPEELMWLESLLHPRVIAAYLAWRDDLRRLQDPPAVCATEVPLLYEVGGDKEFDAVVVITAPSEVRVARHVRPMLDREVRLIPDAKKVERADFAYVNDGSLEELDAFVGRVVEELAA